MPADLLLYYTYAYTTLEALLFIGAAIYCFRLTRITGAFRAWILLIAALALIAFIALASALRMVIFESPQAIEAILARSTAIGVLGGSAVGIVLSVLFFFAMFELYSTFQRIHAPQSADTTTSTTTSPLE